MKFGVSFQAQMPTCRLDLDVSESQIQKNKLCPTIRYLLEYRQLFYMYFRAQPEEAELMPFTQELSGYRAC